MEQKRILPTKGLPLVGKERQRGREAGRERERGYLTFVAPENRFVREILF